MKLTLEEIKAAVLDGKIKALTIDTTVVDGNGRNLEHGLLRRLRQFKGSQARLVLSEVVLGEIERHLLKDAEESMAKIRSATRSALQTWGLASAAKAAIESQIFAGRSAETVAKERIESFVGETGAEVVAPSFGVDVDAVFEDYFKSQPPFGKSDNKKSEFPDAFALRSLEAWARERSVAILAVSKDGDWAKYSDGSDSLVVVDDIALALSCFQSESADYFVKMLNGLAQKESKLGIENAIASQLDEQLESVELDFDAWSDSTFEPNSWEYTLTFKGISGLGEGLAFEAIELKDDKLVVSFAIDAAAEGRISFAFSFWDGAAKKSVWFGSTRCGFEEPIEIDAIATFDVVKNGANLVLKEIEIPKQRVGIEIGEIEPDWAGRHGDGDSGGSA